MANEEKLRQYLRKVTGELYRYRQGTGIATTDPVVIVGMSCRFPGQVTSPEELWRLVDSAGDAISGFPRNRGWDTENDLGPKQRRAGGFLHDGDHFDAAFFGLGPQEAFVLDPQQRLLLETAWEAFESSGIDVSLVRGTRVGVYAGMTGLGYGFHADVRDEQADYLTTGAAGSAASGRIAYVLGLEGPAITIDTACSSSLVAMDLACRALRTGDCEMALAGGVTFMPTPGLFAHYGRRQELAADGRCKPFSATADGMGLAEGAGMLLLEKLSDARRGRHPVLAVVRGSAVGQGGTTSGLTAPNGPAQERVISLALADARLTPDQVDAVEAHGTGSPLGDQIEAQALISVYGQTRNAPLRLGSVKSNIGHTQAAAGVAAVIKSVLALTHERLPRTLHVSEPMEEIDWVGGQVRLLTEDADWPRSDSPRRIGVSAFGFTGTNAHVILEEPPSAKPGEAGEADEATRPPGVVPWAISAADPAALRAQAVLLGEVSGAEPADVGLSLARSRMSMRYRAAIIGEHPADFRTALGALSRKQRGPAPPRRAEMAFLLPARPVSGGEELYSAFPVFAAAMDQLRDESGDLPPFAFEAAVYRLLESFAVIPDYVVGSDAPRFCADAVSPASRSAPVPEPGGLARTGATFRLGLGPGSAMDAPVDACVLQEGLAEPTAFLTALARAYEHGHAVDWKAAFAGVRAQTIPLPTYPFQRRRYWLDAARPVIHPLLGSAADLAAEPGHRYEHRLTPWYGDGHRLFGVPVLPAGAVIEWAVAARSMTTGLPVTLRNLLIRRLPPLPADAQTVANDRDLRCYAQSEQSWAEVASAEADEPGAPPPARPMTPGAMEELDASAVYERLSRAGLDCESGIRALTRLWRRGDEVLALVSAATDSPYVVDPVALDACLRAAAVLQGDGLWMAGSVERLSVHGRPQGDVWCLASRLADDRLDLDLRSQGGEPLVLLHGLRLELATPQTLGGGSWPRVRELSALLASDPDAARQSLLASLLGRLESFVTADVAADTRLNGIGLGSLQAVRLRNALARDYAADVPLSTLLGTSTPEDLADLICEQLAVRDLLAASESSAEEDVEVLSI